MPRLPPLATENCRPWQFVFPARPASPHVVLSAFGANNLFSHVFVDVVRGATICCRPWFCFLVRGAILVRRSVSHFVGTASYLGSVAFLCFSVFQCDSAAVCCISPDSTWCRRHVRVPLCDARHCVAPFNFYFHCMGRGIMLASPPAVFSNAQIHVG